MDEKIAREMLQQLARFTDAWNELSEITMRIEDESERVAFRRTLAQIIADCDHTLIRPLERKFPHLEGIAIKKID